MQSAVSTGVMEMDNFTQAVEQSVASVSNIGGQLGQIIEQVQALTPRYDAVNQGMEAQAQGAQQIRGVMEPLSEASAQTVNSLQDINGAIAELAQIAQQLQQAIARSKVNAETSTKKADMKDYGYS